MTELAQKVLDITVPYLGPASRVFLGRQTNYHMGGLIFEDLENKHLPALSHWVRISAALLINKGKALELSQRIANLQGK